MKSYFAKLAARATLANVPVSSGVTAPRTSDPFEDASLSQSPVPTLGAAKPNPAVGESLQSVPRSPMRRTERVHTQSEKVASTSDRLSREPTTLSPKTQPVTSALERPDRTKLGPAAPATESRTHSDRQNLELNPPVSPTHLIPQPEHSRAGPLMHASEASEDSNEKTTPQTDRRLSEIESEQLVLLRKADAFMESLLDRREPSVTHQEIDTDEDRQLTRSEREIPIDQPARLQPVPAPRVPEPPEEQASLVIGKLTVEVVPPAREPVAPSPRVVVVRGTRGGQTGVHSSQRFGLGQF
jgi:hypothetical protein